MPDISCQGSVSSETASQDCQVQEGVIMRTFEVSNSEIEQVNAGLALAQPAFFFLEFLLYNNHTALSNWVLL
jgi:hypothetical protein